MLPPAPRLFDAALARARLRRAYRQGAAGFLLARVAADLAERVAIVQRRFSSAIDLASPGPHLAQALRSLPNVAAAHQFAPVAAALAGPGAVADPQALPLAPASVDLVASALALHVVDDLPGALVQIRRALAPDGLFLACLPGGQTLHELRTCLASAEAEISGGASPRVAPFADLRDLGGLLQRAGFALPVTDVETLTLRYESMFGLLRDLRGMGATNALVARSRQFLRRDVLARAAAIYAETFADADGRVRATVELIYLSGWRPHESQARPLRPGSAQTRLAAALGVAELKA